MNDSGWRVEAVRGRLEDETSEQLVEFWTSRGALDETAARERLDQVICVLYDGDDEVSGVNSVYAATAPLVGRQMWIYRRFVDHAVGADAEAALLSAAFDELAGEFGGAPRDPIGLYLLVTDRAFIASRPEAVWPQTNFLFAGYTDDGAQVRVRYFDGARI